MTTADICVCLAHIDFDACMNAAQTYSIVELRLDLLQLTRRQIKQVLESSAATIATFRTNNCDSAERLRELTFAIENGADYVDIELEAPQEYRKTLTECARTNNCGVIVSYHNFNHTPTTEELQKIAAQAREMDADIVKIVAMARTASDAARIISLYNADNHKKLIAFAMGSAGTITRIAAPLLGAPFTYAALSADCSTAPNQLDALQLTKIYRLME